MKKYYLIVLSLLACTSILKAQKPVAYAVRVSATVQVSPASITLHWPKDSSVVTKFQIYRKLKTDANFSTLLASLPGTDTTYTDNTVSAATYYEYELVKTIKNNAYFGYGYIASGIDIPATEARGTAILIYDEAFLPTLQTQITRLVSDMTEDGWTVISHGVSIADSVTTIHSIIQSDYNADPSHVKEVFLLGHIPVPYSGGNLNNGLNPIDGHDWRERSSLAAPYHNGAWPADIYYGVMNATWTDNSVTDTDGSYSANHNVPGDGKFDQDDIPASAALGVGRVDMYNMPAFAPLTEMDLIKRYLDKDHRWRIGQVAMKQRGYVKDYFGVVSYEAFSASAYSGFSTMFGSKNVTDTGTWEKVLSKNSFLWSYGCGGGTFTNASNISSTTNFVTDSLQTVFTMLFGSWFGDWNTSNNYLRAALASKGPILTDCWSGRPEWQFHNMAMGDEIGYSALINFNDYAKAASDPTNYFRSSIMWSTDRMIHAALMGDPTIRMHVVQPTGTLTLAQNDGSIKLHWKASTESGLLGYYVYRSSGMNQPFTNISGTMVTDTIYTDNSPLTTVNYYMVRAVKLEQSSSGTYYNLSEGSMDTITPNNSNNIGSALPVSLVTFTAQYQDGHVNLNWATSSEQNNAYFDIERAPDASTWTKIGQVEGHGTSNVANSYISIDSLAGVIPTGTFYYRLKQVDFNGAFTYSPIRLVNIANQVVFSAYPNPTTDMINVNWVNKDDGIAVISLVNMSGETVYNQNVSGKGMIQKQIDMRTMPAGVYHLEVISGDKVADRCLVSKN